MAADIEPLPGPITNHVAADMATVDTPHPSVILERRRRHPLLSQFNIHLIPN
jgi:hypothetical protein